MPDFPKFLQDMIDNRPTAGGGVNKWIYRVARHLHAHMSALEMIAFFESRTRNCGREVTLKEITRQVSCSLATAWRRREDGAAPLPPQKNKPKWPECDFHKRQKIVDQCYGLADLWEESPRRFDDDLSHTEEIIDRLFPGNPWLCCGQSNNNCDTRHREDWGDLSGFQLIVPNPMSARRGLTLDKKPSKRSLNNTGPRRFQVCEFDGGSFDEQAAIILHLAEFAPLVLALHSGGKSIHGWFFVAGQSEEKIKRFFRYAVSLGADDATSSPVQLVRMPDGARANGNRQTTYFFDPDLIPSNP